MSPTRIKPGAIGRIDWDYERTPGKIRGVARTRDGADRPRRVVAVRDTRAEVEAELRMKAASLVYLGDVWSRSTTLEEAIERWIATLSDADEGNAQKPQSAETYARTARGVIVPRIGALCLGDITTPQLRDFMKEMRVAPPSHSTRQGRGRLFGLLPSAHSSRAPGLAWTCGQHGCHTFQPGARSAEAFEKGKGSEAAEAGPHSRTGGRAARLRPPVGGQQQIGAASGPAVATGDRTRLGHGCRIGEVGGFLMEETVDVPSLRVSVTGTIITVAGKTFRANELKRTSRCGY